MKNILKRLPMLLALALSAACNQPERAHRDKVPTGSADSIAGTTTTAQTATADVNLNADEKAFLTAAHSRLLFEAEASAIAAQSGANQEVKELAKTSSLAARKMVNDITAIAKGKGILLDALPSTSQQAQLDALKKMSAKDIDAQYLKQSLEGQAALASVFDKGTKLANKDLSNFANNAVATFAAQQQHLTVVIRKGEKNKH